VLRRLKDREPLKEEIQNDDNLSDKISQENLNTESQPIAPETE